VGAIAILACDERADAQVVSRMLDPVPHRGTSRDIASIGSITLGVLGDGDAWITEAEGWIAAFVGRLDNPATVWREIGRAEEPPPDPATILMQAARRRGTVDAAGLMRGRFVFAIAHGDELEVGRDQIGYLPLFMAERARHTLVATEIKQVLAGLNGEPREPNTEFLHGLVFGADTDWRITPYAGVERLPRASTVTFRLGRRTGSHRYWDPTGLVESRDIGLDEAAEELAHLVGQAVERVVTGNDAIGLSGGIDSPTVAAFAAPRHRELSGTPLLAVSAVFPDHPDVDEMPYIQAVVDDLELDLRTFRQVAGPLDDLEHWVRVLDGPGVVPSVPAIAEMYRLTRSLGRSTLLTGELAEYVYNYEFRTLGHLLAHFRWRAAATRIREARSGGRGWASLGREIALSLAPSPLYRSWTLHKGAGQRFTWLDPSHFVPPLPSSEIPSPRRRWSVTQAVPIAPVYPVHGDDVEMCTAWCGIALRTPIADVDVWEYALSLPAEVKYPTVLKKGLVRRAMRGHVPDVILDRRDKTLFDSHGIDLIDYAELQRWILGTKHRLDGIDYDMLGERLERRALPLVEEGTANTVARIHAFLDQW
jgi:asparagine synthase (glutamine-hydrolysing)